RSPVVLRRLLHRSDQQCRGCELGLCGGSGLVARRRSRVRDRRSVELRHFQHPSLALPLRVRKFVLVRYLTQSRICLMIKIMSVSVQPASQERIAAVRRFNRFYTQRIGVLQAAWLDSPFSLTEARVLYELKARDSTTATEIARELGLDAGYLSRILRRFEKLKLIHREISPADARQSFLTLTEHGRKAFAPLEARSNHDVGALLARLPAAQQDDLVGALRTAESLMSEAWPGSADVSLRAPKAGDLGWIVQRHAVLYAREYGWGDGVEGGGAQVGAAFAAKLA